MLGKMIHMTAILSLNLYVLVAGFAPVAHYQGTTYTIFTFPSEPWYGLLFKVAFLIVLYALFHTIVQVSSPFNDDARDASYQLIVALILNVACMFMIQDASYTVWMYVTHGLLWLAAFMEYRMYLLMKKTNDFFVEAFHTSLEEISHSKRYTEPIEPVPELTPEQKEILYNYSVKSTEKLVRLIQDSERAEMSYRTLTYTTIITTLLFNIPIQYINQVPSTLSMLPDVYSRLATRLILVVFVLSYSLLFNISGKVWPNIVREFDVVVYAYTIFVLLNSIAMYSFTLWIPVLIAVLFYALKNIIYR